MSIRIKSVTRREKYVQMLKVHNLTNVFVDIDNSTVPPLKLHLQTEKNHHHRFNENV